MKTQMGWTAFLVALSTLTMGSVEAAAPVSNALDPSLPAIEGRIARINSALKTQAEKANIPQDMARGWVNGGGGRGFVNTRRGGWGDGVGNRGFVNVNPWRNGWADGGGFVNTRGGSFVNR